MHTFLSRRVVLSVLIGLALAGCGDSKDEKKEKNTQVAAKVNGQEITVHQVNEVLTKAPNMKPEDAKEAGFEVLRNLVDQELLVEQALENKVDRDSRTVSALESARNQILAQGYLEKELAKLPKPSSQEITAYYAEHPELFSERRIYRFQELLINGGADRVEEIRSKIASTPNLTAFVDWLKAEKIPYRVNAAVKKAEELPLDLVPRVHKMKEGQAMVTVNGPNVLVVQLLQSRTQPITQEAATPIIERYLRNAKRRETVAALLKKLRDSSEIEYVGAFADAGKKTVAKPDAPASAPVARPESGVEKPPSGSQATPGSTANPDAAAMEKGLSGL